LWFDQEKPGQLRGRRKRARETKREESEKKENFKGFVLN